MKALFLAAIAAAGVAQAAEITIYKQPNFAGEQLTLRDTTGNLSGNFTDQASSAIVRGGRWQVCTQPNFQGDCLTLEPGQYTRLDAGYAQRFAGDAGRALSEVQGQRTEMQRAAGVSW